MDKWSVTCSVIALLLSAPIWANVDSSGYKFSAYGGMQRIIINPTSFTLAGNETEVLAPYRERNTNTTWGLGAAYRFITPNQNTIFRYTHDVSVGLDVFYFQTTQRGDTLDYGVSPDFNYLLKVQSLRFMGNVEWTFLPIKSQIFPFLEFGAGVASNANSYADSPNPGATTGVGISFSRHTILSMAYDLGAGLKWLPTKNVEISLRYLYADLGSAYSGTTANLPVEEQYKIRLKTQSLLLGLSYLFK